MIRKPYASVLQGSWRGYRQRAVVTGGAQRRASAGNLRSCQDSLVCESPSTRWHFRSARWFQSLGYTPPSMDNPRALPHGLAVVGTSLLLEGKIVGAAVGGYVLAEFSQVSNSEPGTPGWNSVRTSVGSGTQTAPVPQNRLIVRGELSQTIRLIFDQPQKTNLHIPCF
jgi:hypothetical protein